MQAKEGCRRQGRVAIYTESSGRALQCFINMYGQGGRLLGHRVKNTDTRDSVILRGAFMVQSVKHLTLESWLRS